ncbi:beta strand repeat-containing protein [Roseateles albus]|uniref:PEP-CTERM sorting domain-containing protein n=1 Tax=Roseateles albus TaxID=2987525 RepID=A0ABT5K9J7_9BURK|nr:PEP-CTERM sorting domain-containing protein [Roseateles albus]MDC8770072.1 PEP-CTERM sorting domain-containing protein [Roseateles albus]
MSVRQNWNPGVTPMGFDHLHFGTSTFTTVTYDPLSNRSYDKISFDVGANAFTLQSAGNSLALSHGIVNNSSKVQTLVWSASSLFIDGDQTWDGGTAGMNITGGIGQRNDLTLSNKVAYKNLGSALIGDSGSGNSKVSLTINSGSSFSTAADLTLGSAFPTSSGTINVQGVGSSLVVGTDLILGDVGSSTLLIDSGASASSQRLFIGKKGTAKLTVDGAGSSFSSGDVSFSNSELIVSGGGKFTATINMTDSFTPNENASVTVKDTGTLFKVDLGFYLGSKGNGLMQLSKGATAEISSLFIGQQSTGGFGVLEATGLGSTLKTKVVIGRAGLLNVSNGAQVQVSDWMNIGEAGESSFAAAVGGGGALLSVAQALTVGSAGAGRLDVLGGGVVDVGQLVIGDLGVVNLQGGTLKMVTGNIAGTLNWDSGTLNFKSNYATGDFLGHDMVLSAGQILKGDAQIRVGSGDSLTFAGGALQAIDFQMDANASAKVGRASSLAANTIKNYGRLMLDGGSVNGALLNAGTMTGSGAIRANLGQGGFINSGRFDQGDYVELVNPGSNINTGVWTLGKGGALQLRSSNLNNQGLMSLAGASIGAFDGTSKLVNEAGGMISGNGVISASFANQGSLIVEGGKLSVDKRFANSGQILLTSAIASLSGGAIDNSGRIEGLGQIGNAINNQGFVSAKGGILTLAAGGISNRGTLSVDRDATLRLTQGLLPNMGKIQLAGGTFDNNGFAMSNEVGAVINGFGSLNSGLLTNKGKILLSGGNSTIYADMLSTAASQIILSGNSNSTFYGNVDVQNGAELRVSTGSVATFFGTVQQRTGAKFSGAGAKRFEGTLTVGASPGLGSDEGDVEFGDSSTYLAEIGGITACTLRCGSDEAFKNSSFDKYIVAGNLSLNGTLKLTSWNGFVAQKGQSFDLLDWGTLTGTFADIDATGFKLAAGTQLDYSQLYTSGEIRVMAAPVPEPETYALMLAGLGLLAWRRRKFG